MYDKKNWGIFHTKTFTLLSVLQQQLAAPAVDLTLGIFNELLTVLKFIFELASCC
jgi:hypothetical protein